MADLEQPPSTRPVIAGASLRSVRTVDNLQRLLDGRPAGKSPVGLLRTQTLSRSLSEVGHKALYYNHDSFESHPAVGAAALSCAPRQ